MIRAGIDLGAHSMRLIISGEGLVFDEPSIAAFNEKGNILAIGSQAYDMRSSRDEKVTLVRPISADGLDLNSLEAMLNELCYEFRLFRLFQKTALLVCYPSHFDEASIEHLKDTLSDLGADRLYFDPEIWMAAIGSGLDLFLPVSSCVLSAGYSNCDLAVFRNGKLIHKSSSTSLNGEKVSTLIGQYVLDQQNVILDEKALSTIVQKIGCVRLKTENRGIQVTGKDRRTSQKKQIVITENEVATVLAPFVRDTGSWILSFLSRLPRDVQADLKERGIVASGGTMKITGLADQISSMCSCPVYVTDEPDRTVSRGLEALLETII